MARTSNGFSGMKEGGHGQTEETSFPNTINGANRGISQVGERVGNSLPDSESKRPGSAGARKAINSRIITRPARK